MAAYIKSNTIPLNCSYTHTITATDVSDGYIEIDFDCSWNLTGTVQCVSSTGVVITMSDTIITFPSTGKIRIEDGTSLVVFVAGNILRMSLDRDTAQFIQ